jgi:hypothetical protein
MKCPEQVESHMLFILMLGILFLGIVGCGTEDNKSSKGNFYAKQIGNELALEICKCVETVPDTVAGVLIDSMVTNCIQAPFVQADPLEITNEVLEYALKNLHDNCPLSEILYCKASIDILGIDTTKHELSIDDCQIIRSGKFLYLNVETGGEYYIITEDESIMYRDHEKAKRFTVNWLTDCKYEITVVESFDELNSAPYVGERSTVELLNIHGDTVTFKGDNSKYSLIYSVLKVRDN